MPHRGNSNEYTEYTIFEYEQEKQPKLSQICNYGTQERVQNSRGKRAINVRAIEVLLYFCTEKKIRNILKSHLLWSSEMHFEEAHSLMLAKG